MVRSLIVSIATLAVVSLAASPASAQFGQGNSANNLFSQYYTQPGASTAQAGAYMAPHYVPANVGHTYYTYQPLMPHEMMHQHTRNYYNYYNTGGYYGGYDALNKTTVRWQSGSNHMGSMPFSGGYLQALQWKYNKSRYCLNNPGAAGCGGVSHGLGRGHLRGKFGCTGGDCDTSYGGEVYGGESYGGEVYGGEVYGGGGCSSCTANAGQAIQR